MWCGRARQAQIPMLSPHLRLLPPSRIKMKKKVQRRRVPAHLMVRRVVQITHFAASRPSQHKVPPSLQFFFFFGVFHPNPAEPQKTEQPDGQVTKSSTTVTSDNIEDQLDFDESDPLESETAGATGADASGPAAASDESAQSANSIVLFCRLVPDQVSTASLERACRSISGFVRIGLSTPSATRQKVG